MTNLTKPLKLLFWAAWLVLTAPVAWFRWLSYKWQCRVSVSVFPVLSVFLFMGTVRQLDADGCPLALDLNGNGFIDITGHVQTQDKLYTLFSLVGFGQPAFVSFDIFANGEHVFVDWITPHTDAFLVDLRYGIPEKIDGSYLFGTAGFSDDPRQGFADGFAKLAVLDTDGSGFVEGAELTGLALWKDDGDGLLAEGEVVTLDSQRIIALPVQGTREREYSPYELEKHFAYARTAPAEGQSFSGRVYVEDIWFMLSTQPHWVDQFLSNPAGFIRDRLGADV